MLKSSLSWQNLLILGVGVLAVSTSAIWVRLALKVADTQGLEFSLFLAAGRLTLASLMLIPTWHRFKGVKADLIAYLWAIGAGIVLSLHFTAWITSLSFTSIAAATVIVTTNPVWVAALGWIFWREKVSKMTLIGIAIALGGGLIIVGGVLSPEQQNNSLFGDFLALIGAWMASLYLIFGREAQRHGLTLHQYIIIVYGLAALILLPFPPLLGVNYGDYPLSVYVFWILMAIFPQLVGHTIFNWAITQMPATLVALVLLCEPVGASLLGILIFGEFPDINVILGGFILLLGVGLSIRGNRPYSPDS